MKKKLLFSLLLGSSFVWMNGIYAATDVAKSVDAAPAVVDKSGDKGKAAEAQQQTYKIKTLDGKDISITIHKKDSNIIYSDYAILDGSYYMYDTDKARGKVNAQNIGENAVPFVAGQELPPGYKIINCFFKLSDDGDLNDLYGGSGKKCKADFSNAIIQTDDIVNIRPPEGYGAPDEYAWMLMSPDGEIFIGKYYTDPNAKKFFAGQRLYDQDKTTATKVRLFSLPNAEETQKLKDAASKGGGASSEQVKALESQIEQLKQRPGTVGNLGSSSVLSDIVKFKATPEMQPLSFVVTCTTEAALKNPQLFTKFVEDLNLLLTKCPQVVAYMLSKMIGSQIIQDSQSPQFTKDFKTFTWEGRDGVIAEISLEQSTTAAAINAQLEKIFKNKAAIDPTAVAAHIDELNANAAQITAELEAQNAKLKAALEAQNAKLDATEKVAADALSTAEQNKAEAEKAKAIAQQNAIIANENADKAVKLAAGLTSEQQQSSAAKAQLEAEEAARQQLEAAQKLLEQEKLNSEVEKQRLQAEADAAKNALEAAKDTIEKEEEARQRIEKEKLDKEKEALDLAPTINAEDGGKKDEVAAEKTHAPAQQLDNVPAPVTHEAAKVEPQNVHAPAQQLDNVPAPVTHEAAKVEPQNVHAPAQQLNNVPAPTTKKEVGGKPDEINVVGETVGH